MLGFGNAVVPGHLKGEPGLCPADLLWLCEAAGDTVLSGTVKGGPAQPTVRPSSCAGRLPALADRARGAEEPTVKRKTLNPTSKITASPNKEHRVLILTRSVSKDTFYKEKRIA